MSRFDSSDFGRVDTDPSDLQRATWWKVTAETLAKWALEDLPPSHPERRELTELLVTIRLGDAALVAEYREWRRRHPKLTAGMARAGKLHDARSRRRLARWLADPETMTTLDRPLEAQP